jgi:ribA/ribD-fused uncharacterized protein
MPEYLHQFAADGSPMVIAWFDDFDGEHEYRVLSNFYEGEPIWIPVMKEFFATGEHAFAAMKAGSNRDMMAIQSASSPGQAKALGRSVRLRHNWEVIKYDAMMAVLRAKFTLDREEGHVLLKTEDALLVEGTYWHDQVWGVALNSRTADPLLAPGRNWLGTMLMARRAELRAEQMFRVAHPTVAYNAQFARQ